MSLAEVLTTLADTIRKKGNYYCAKANSSGNDVTLDIVFMRKMSLGVMPDRITKACDYAESAGIKQGKTEGYTQAERDFWNILQQDGNRFTYNYAFFAPANTASDPVWTDENFKPIYPIVCNTGNSCRFMLCNSGVTSIDVPVYIYNAGTGTAASANTFANNSKLHTIRKLYVHEGCKFSNWFLNDTALEKINMDGDSVISENISFADCPLSYDSVISILLQMKDLTGETTKTLTLSETTISNIIAEEGTISNVQGVLTIKNWTLAY